MDSSFASGASSRVVRIVTIGFTLFSSCRLWFSFCYSPLAASLDQVNGGERVGVGFDPLAQVLTGR
jgi:hypothetical protein